MYRLLLLATVCLGAHHPELLGEDPDHADVVRDTEVSCYDGFPSGQCAARCFSQDTSPTCLGGGSCVCEPLAPTPLLGPSMVLQELVEEARQDRSPLGILQDFALDSALIFYLAVICLFLYCRKRCPRRKSPAVAI